MLIAPKRRLVISSTYAVVERIGNARLRRAVHTPQKQQKLPLRARLVRSIRTRPLRHIARNIKKICETLQISSDTILFTETIQADMAVEKLTNKFLNMTPEQLRIMEAITNAFLQASNK